MHKSQIRIHPLRLQQQQRRPQQQQRRERVPAIFWKALTAAENTRASQHHGRAVAERAEPLRAERG